MLGVREGGPAAFYPPSQGENRWLFSRTSLLASFEQPLAGDVIRLCEEGAEGTGKEVTIRAFSP